MLPPRPRCSSTYQVYFNPQLQTTILATKPAEITLALQKATEGFTDIVDQPTDTKIIDIRQLILTVLMKTKKDELTSTHNLSVVILPTARYKHIYSKGVYSILLVIALYKFCVDFGQGTHFFATPEQEV